MEHIQKSRSAVIPSARLFLEDVEEIISTLKKISENVSISDRDFRYESLEQLIEKVGKSPRVLKISCTTPYLSIDFDWHSFPTATFLFAGAYGDSDAVFLKFREMLNRRQHWANHVIRFDIALVLYVAFVILTPLSISILKQWLPEVSTRIVLVSIVFTYSIVAILLHTGMLYSIQLVKRHEKLTFWKQNSGTIILLVIGAIVAEFIRWLATLLTK